MPSIFPNGPRKFATAQAAVEQAERELQALEQAAGSFAAIPVREVPWLMPRGEVPPSDAHYA